MGFREDAKVLMGDLREAFNGNISVESSKNDLGDISTYIAVCENDIWDDTTTYATIGLSTVATGYSLDGVDLAVELVAVVGCNVLDYGNVLGSIVTNAKSFGLPCIEGSIHDDVLSMYYPDIDAKHVFLTQSWLWDDLYISNLNNKKVTWLTPIPITDSEKQFIEQYGGSVFLNILEENNINVQDIYRSFVC